MSYTKSQFITALQGMAAVQSTDSDFGAIVNSAIDYAEQRIYREIDFLATTAVESSLKLTPNVRSLTISAPTAFVVLQEVSVKTKLSPADALFSRKSVLHPASRELLDAVYGSPIPTGQPKWFAMLDQATIVVGPWPDMAYPVELVGTVRPQPLYALGDTGSTFISANLPALFMAATMIFVAGFQKNFGAQADDPRSAMSWEALYQNLKASAVTEEARKKFAASGWTSLSQPEAATQSR